MVKLPKYFWLAILVCWPSAVLADHDARDPDGICLGLANIAASWAEARAGGMSEAELEKQVAITPEQVEKVKPNLRGLLIRATSKGLELANAKPQKELPVVWEEFYEWCLPQLPKAGAI